MSLVFEILFFCVFVLFLIAFVVILVSNLKRWYKNNRSPRLTVDATVVAKRESVSHSQQPMAGDPTGAHGFSTTTFVTYYATFEVESGDRLELEVPSSDFGYLVEGDRGKLQFQGTRFLSFTRT